LLQATTSHTTTATSLESSPWWLDLSDWPRNCPKQCALLTLLALVIDHPFADMFGPRMDPLGEMHPLCYLENCSLVIPLSESADMCLKLIALAYCEMGQKDFPGSDLMIAQEPQMCPPQVPQPQRLENAPEMISLSEFDEKPGKGCAFPSSQLGRKGVSGFSLDGTSRLNTSSEGAPSP
jgi:hypothetical protein